MHKAPHMDESELSMVDNCKKEGLTRALSRIFGEDRDAEQAGEAGEVGEETIHCYYQD